MKEGQSWHALRLPWAHHVRDRSDELRPFRALGLELLSAGGGETVVLELTRQLTARLPFAANQSSALESMERWVERAMFDREDVVGRLANVVRDAPPMR